MQSACSYERSVFFLSCLLAPYSRYSRIIASISIKKAPSFVRLHCLLIGSGKRTKQGAYYFCNSGIYRLILSLLPTNPLK